MVAGERHALGDDVLAAVDHRVEVAEGLGHRLDALPRAAGHRVERLGLLDLAGLDGGDELGGAGEQLVGLGADVALVVGDRLGDLLVGVLAAAVVPVTVKSPRMPSPFMPGLHAVV